MLLTISTTHSPATDLGYLLHKNPARPQSKPLAFGQAYVFYPEATPDRCTAALLLDIDPIALVRGRPDRGSQASPSFSLGQYVNDRPYAAGSFLSVAIAQLFGTALGGRCKDRQALADTAIPLEAVIHGLPSRGGPTLIEHLFAPLGYSIAIEPIPLDTAFPEFGAAIYFNVTLAATIKLSDLLGHLYVLIPVLDNAKHYYVGEDEIDKLLRHGEGWLANHPLRDEIARRYLRRRHSLVRQALEQLVADEPLPAEAIATDSAEAAIEADVAPELSIHEQRLAAVVAVLEREGCRHVADLGCGEGRLLRLLLKSKQFVRIVGVDVSPRTLEYAERRLKLDRLHETKRHRITLAQGALTYRDRRLERGGELAGPEGFDAAALVEVIEHLDEPRLASLERVVFGQVKPRVVVITTPNAEYNALFPTLAARAFRHRDHRFEWNRAQFAAWCERVGEHFGYSAEITGIGPVDESLGSLSQMAVFTRKPAKAAS